MLVKAVILDYDGVIVDSSREGRKRLFKIMRGRGYEITAEIRQYTKIGWGTNAKKLLKTCFNLNPKTAESIEREWERLDITSPPSLIRGARKTLRALRRAGFRISILTNRRRPSLMSTLEHYALVKFFDFLQTRDDWSFFKPDPRAFYFTLQRLHAKYEILTNECIYVGDTPVDFHAASKSGVENISVLSGILDREDFLKIGQKKENVIGSIADIPKWIQKHQDC